MSGFFNEVGMSRVQVPVPHTGNADLAFVFLITTTAFR